MNKKITLSDIAQRTGLSPATISRALNHKHLVNADTYNTVISVMKELGYEIPQEPIISEQPVGKRILVVNVSDISNSFYGKIYEGIIASATNHGWYVMFNQDPINSSTLEHFLHMLTSCNAIGLIAFNSIDRFILDTLIEYLPVIQCCEFDPHAKAPYIGIDNFSSTVTLMEYLISHNHQKIAILNGPMNLKSEQERQRGYEFALQRAKIPIDQELIIHIPASDYFMAHTRMAQLLQSKNIPDAIFAVSDVLAFASVVATKECGLCIPEDIAIIGFDNISLSEMSIPKITTVNHPRFEIGFLGGEMIQKQCVDRSELPKSILLNTELILREST